MLRKILRVIRTLKQEYGYILLDRIVRKKIYSLPEIVAFEELERAMIATQAKKITATFRFVMQQKGHSYKSDMEIEISG